MNKFKPKKKPVVKTASEPKGEGLKKQGVITEPPEKKAGTGLLAAAKALFNTPVSDDKAAEDKLKSASADIE